MTQQFHFQVLIQSKQKNINQKRYKHLYVHYRILYNSPRYGNNLSVNQLMKRVKKMWYIYTVEFYSVIKKMKFCHF